MHANDLLNMFLSAPPVVGAPAAWVRLAARADATGYAWSTGRLLAWVRPEAVVLLRRFGAVGGAGLVSRLEVPLERLPALAAAAAAWASRREGWASFAHQGSAMGGGAWVYQAPGGGSPPVTVGRTGALADGGGFEGVEEERLLTIPELLPAGVRVVSAIWRLGERWGAPEGEEVGARFELGGGWWLEARRREARVVPPEGAGLALEPGEAAALGALG